LPHHRIDKEKWDACISGSCNPIVYAYSWYLDAVSPGWEALVEDDYCSVFPLTAKKKLGLNYLSQPYFTQQLGVFSERIFSSGEILAFIQTIPRKFITINIH